MPSLALDPTQDRSGRQFYAIFGNAELPDFFKTAEYDNIHETEGLPSSAFADKGRKAFPIHSKEACFASHGYVTANKDAIVKSAGKHYHAHIVAQVKTAAELFGITDDLAKFDAGTLSKTASEVETQFMGEFEVNDNQIGLFPVKTASDLVKQANLFAQEMHKLPIEWRFEVADNMSKAATELGVDELPEIVAKYAGLYFVDVAEAQKELNRRSTKLASAEAKASYAEMANLVPSLRSVDEFRKVATFCFHAEQGEGLYDNYKVASILLDPVERLFSVPMSKVASMLDTVTMGGREFQVSSLKKVAAAVYKQAFDIEIDPSDSTALMDVLPTMPLSDVALFQELSGVKSVA